MNDTLLRFFRLLSIFCGLVLFGCKSQSTVTHQPATEATERIPTDKPPVSGQAPMNEQKDKEILAEKENLVFEMLQNGCTNQNDCKVIAFGAKPCGGPWKYIAYNPSKMDEAEFRIRVSEHFDWENQMNKKYQYGSNCMFVTEPEVECIQEKCSIPGFHGE